MRKTRFSKRERTLLVILLLLILGLLYYQFVFVPVTEQIARSNTAALEQQIQTEQIRAKQIRNMKAEMEENLSQDGGVVESYDNFKNVAEFLNTVFDGNAVEYNFDYRKPVADQDAVRRNIVISFTAKNYRVARDIIQKLHDSHYRTLIRDMSITAVALNKEADPSVLTSGVKCTMTVTFFETMVDATTQAGLEFKKVQDAASGNS